MFPDYTSVSHYYDLTGCSGEFKIVFKHAEESKDFSIKAWHQAELPSHYIFQSHTVWL